MLILESPRLALRHFEPRDLKPLARLYGDPDIRRYYPDGVRTLEETREELEWFSKGHPDRPQLGLWATIYKPTGKLIGRCGLLPWTLNGVDEVEVAYMIDKSLWRQGLGTEAAAAVARYAHERLGVRRLISLVHPDNVASRGVAESIGMRLERALDGAQDPALLYARAAADPYSAKRQTR
jgi:ribosomal-protein-alanine N-acetyltransferase